MNSNVNDYSIVRIAKDELEQLTSEVKETVATEVKKTTFSTVDLWHIQKQMKTAASSTKRWNLN